MRMALGGGEPSRGEADRCGGTGDGDSLDCHPILREYFGDQLREGNRRLGARRTAGCMNTTSSIAKEFPDTIEEMAPLYAAVAHGCQAGRHQERWTMCTIGESKEAANISTG